MAYTNQLNVWQNLKVMKLKTNLNKEILFNKNKITVNFQRKANALGKQAFFGFDNLEIKKKNGQGKYKILSFYMFKVV